MADGCTIRDAIESDLTYVLKWWAEDFSGDYELKMHKDILKYGEGGGAFTAVTTSGEPVGFLNCAVVGNEAFVGHFIVRSDLRGTGIGTMLLKRVREHAGHRNLALDSVMHRVQFYKKHGFTTESFIMTNRYCTVDHAKIAASLKLEDDANIIVKPYNEEMLQAVLDYDRTIAGHDRGDYLRPYLQAYKKLVFVATDAEGKLTGYVVAVNMTGDVSYGIFPLYGDTEQVLRQLMRQVLMALPDESEICLHTPGDNTPAIKMIEALGARFVMHEQRMYAKDEVTLPLEKVASVLNDVAFGI
ncbi:PREDICTED: uncharacterized protein LOC106814542 [Priapulus caudatus]|uniref:Uncharacterized protein LOC106814542 n=1 Tax=Priapulus caudatus TaxID=37621 RepID=A0ABM1EQ76_PRICU|nr:PREDICTED: uncharacterized protein LOC106814542 [Priapulus caudatus]